MHAKLLQLCPPLCDSMDHSLPGSSVHRILQERILGWVAISSCRGSSQPRDRTCISCDSCIDRQFFIASTTGKSKETHTKFSFSLLWYCGEKINMSSIYYYIHLCSFQYFCYIWINSYFLFYKLFSNIWILFFVLVFIKDKPDWLLVAGITFCCFLLLLLFLCFLATVKSLLTSKASVQHIKISIQALCK